MIALPMWSPWDWLLVLGAKRVETRSRAPQARMVGQRLAIYSTVSYAPGGKGELLRLAATEHFSDALAGVQEYPRGAMIGTAKLERFSKMTVESIARLRDEHPAEFAFGFYLPGRYAWVMREPEVFAEPIPARPPVNHRGPFEWDPGAPFPGHAAPPPKDDGAPELEQLSLLGGS